MDRKVWRAAVIGVINSQTRLSNWTELNWKLQSLSPDIFINSVAQSCATVCDPMDCSKPGFPVHHQLPELAQMHVQWVGDAIQPSHPLVPFSSHLLSFPAPGSFPMGQFFASGGQSIGHFIKIIILDCETFELPAWLIADWLTLKLFYTN